jgi:Fe-S cluster assembly iron-binding protein IscA
MSSEFANMMNEYGFPFGGLKQMSLALTTRAVDKVKEILASQEPKPAGLRIAVVGGGCSGFSYSMAF